MITTADELVSKVLVRCSWPSDGTAPFTTAEILRIANEEIAGNIWPQVIKSQGDYYTATLDQDVTAGKTRYKLPRNSYGPIRDVLFIDTDDTDHPEGSSIPKIDLEEIGRSSGGFGASESGFHFFVDGDLLGLTQGGLAPDRTFGTLRIRYYRHPNTLALAATCTTLTSLVEATKTFNVAANLSLANGSRFDIISQGNAHSLLHDRLTVASSTASTVVATESIDDTLAESGDYLAPHGTTPILQVPDHMAPWAVQLIAAACLSAHQDKGAASDAAGAARDLAANATSISHPRTEAEPTILAPRNSTLRWRR